MLAFAFSTTLLSEIQPNKSPRRAAHTVTKYAPGYE
jgi:hypothetical protein